MANVFIGKTGTRLRFNKLTAAQLAAATTQASSVMLASLTSCSHVAYFSNNLDTEVAILAVPPDVNASATTNRFVLFEMAIGQCINFDYSLLEFEPGTQLFVYYLGGVAPSSGSLKVLYWG